MPRYIPQRPDTMSWLVLLVLVIGYGVALYQLPWVLGILTVVGAIGSVIVSHNFKARLTARLTSLAALRSNESICTFAKSFNTREVDTWVIRAVYEQLQNYLEASYPQFPIRADDQLDGCLITDPDDLDLDLAKEISMRTGRSLESAKDNPYYANIKTVRDLVLFFNAQPYANNRCSLDGMK